MLLEFDDVYELNTTHNGFHFTKKINQPVVIEGDGKLWKFETTEVERTLFVICDSSPIIICICYRCTQIIRAIRREFVLSMYGKFIFKDSNFVYLRGDCLNLSTGNISRSPTGFKLDLGSALIFGQNIVTSKQDNIFIDYGYDRFMIHETHVEILTFGHNIINYDPNTQRKIKNVPSDNRDTLLSYYYNGYNLVYDDIKGLIRAYGQLYDDNKHLLVGRVKEQIIYLFWLSNQQIASGRIIKTYLSKTLLINCVLPFLQSGDIIF